MSQRGNPYAHHWNPNGGNYASPIHEAATHPFSAFALGLAHQEVHPDYPCNWQAGVNIKFCKWCVKRAIDRVLYKFHNLPIKKFPGKYLSNPEEYSVWRRKSLQLISSSFSML
ncbi:TPA: hypothetical protein MAM39_002531 [Klebsiella pneumoniae]|nr:hypothetical protein [Klebsiella pneumoniae]